MKLLPKTSPTMKNSALPIWVICSKINVTGLLLSTKMSTETFVLSLFCVCVCFERRRVRGQNVIFQESSAVSQFYFQNVWSLILALLSAHMPHWFWFIFKAPLWFFLWIREIKPLPSYSWRSCSGCCVTWPAALETKVFFGIFRSRYL